MGNWQTFQHPNTPNVPKQNSEPSCPSSNIHSPYWILYKDQRSKQFFKYLKIRLIFHSKNHTEKIKKYIAMDVFWKKLMSCTFQNTLTKFLNFCFFKKQIDQKSAQNGLHYAFSSQELASDNLKFYYFFISFISDN